MLIFGHKTKVMGMLNKLIFKLKLIAVKLLFILFKRDKSFLFDNLALMYISNEDRNLFFSRFTSLYLKLENKRTFFSRFSHQLTDPNDRATVLMDLLGTTSDLISDSNKLDNVANFSAYIRNAWVAEKALSVPANCKVLDAGAGQCQYKKLFSHTKYFAQDFAQYKGNGSGPLTETWVYEKLDYISDITNIPVEDNSFDVVLCTEVLEHVPEPISALKELSRVLAVGGKMFLSAPLGSGVHQEPYHFYGGFSPYFYSHFLSQFGIKVEKIIPIGGQFKHVAQELLRANRELDSHSSLNDLDKIINPWLAIKLHDLDEKFNVEQFTVGYLVEGVKVG